MDNSRPGWETNWRHCRNFYAIRYVTGIRAFTLTYFAIFFVFKQYWSLNMPYCFTNMPIHNDVF